MVFMHVRLIGSCSSASSSLSTATCAVVVVASTSIDSVCLSAPVVVDILALVVVSIRVLDDESAVQDVVAPVAIVVMAVADIVVAMVVGLDSVSYALI